MADTSQCEVSQKVDEPDAKPLGPIETELKHSDRNSGRGGGEDGGVTNSEDGDDADVVRGGGTEAIPDKNTEGRRYIYNMNHQNRGMAIIFNNKTSTKAEQEERKETDKDAANINMALKKLGFDVELHHDQTVAGMLEVIQSAVKSNHSKNDAFAMVILSHGSETGVFGTDTLIAVDKLINPFKGDNCNSLAGKPKLFFIQACRGKQVDGGVIAEADGPENSQIIPTEADILVNYSTVPGSWFIRSLSKVLDRFGEEKEILWMMTRVNAHVAYDFESKTSEVDKDETTQIPAITSTLTKELYFRPKTNKNVALDKVAQDLVAPDLVAPNNMAPNNVAADNMAPDNVDPDMAAQDEVTQAMVDTDKVAPDKSYVCQLF